MSELVRSAQEILEVLERLGVPPVRRVEIETEGDLARITVGRVTVFHRPSSALGWWMNYGSFGTFEEGGSEGLTSLLRNFEVKHPEVHAEENLRRAKRDLPELKLFVG